MSLSATLGRYRLGEQIGEGGMGEVFVGELEGAEGFTRKVAIKRLRAPLAENQELATNLLDEARLAQRLTHGGIVQILDVGLDDGRPFLVTELVDGISLAELASNDEGGAQPIGVSLLIVEAVAEALAHAHDLKSEDGEVATIIHRDVKPANILLSRDGVVKLADFGIGKALSLPSETAPGMIKGTIGYLSLEQARGSQVDERSDQFSLGIVLYELLSGNNPLADAPSILEYLQRLETGVPRLESVDSGLADIVARATAAAASDRYASVDEFRDELVSWRVANGIKARSGQLREAVRAQLGEKKSGLKLALGEELGLSAAATEAAPVTVAPKSGNFVMVAGATLLVLATAVLTWRFLVTEEARPTSQPVAALVDAGAAAPKDAAAVLVIADAATTVAAVQDAAPASDAARTKPTAVVKPGTLLVNVLPWANVSVAGVNYGQAPVTITLPPGFHRVKLSNSNREKVVRVRVRSGKQSHITSW